MAVEIKRYRFVLAMLGVISAVEGVIAILATLGILGQGFPANGYRLTPLRLLVVSGDILAVAGWLVFAYRAWYRNSAQHAWGFWLNYPLRYLFTMALLVICFVSGFTIYHTDPGAFGHFQYYVANLRPQIAWILFLSFQCLVVLGLSLPAIYRDIPQRRGIPAGRLILLLLVALVGIAFYLWLQHRDPRIVSDSGDYLRMANQPLYSRAFYLGLRPWTTAVFYKALWANGFAIVVFQSLLHTLSWGFLIWTVAVFLEHRWLRIGVAGILVLMALAYPVHSWNHVILSESVAISLFIFMLAAAIRLGYGQAGYFYPLALLVVLWINSRETNTWLALPVAAGLIFAGLFWQPRSFYFATGILLLGVIGISFVSTHLANRSNFPLANIVVQRILVDPQALQYFQERGMPVNQKLKKLAGEWAFSQGYAIFNHPKLRSFYRWLNTQGSRDYAVYLLSHPVKTLAAPLINLDKLLQPATDYELSKYTPPILRLTGSVVFIPLPKILVIGVTWILSLIGFIVAIRAHNPLLLIVSFTGILLYPHALLVWHGDAMEIQRHSAQLYVQVYLSFWLLLAAMGDHILRSYALLKRGRLPDRSKAGVSSMGRNGA
jgi:hypothetical protein